MQQKILLLGGSAQQLVAIQAAKELGYHTVLCDYLPDNPGQHVADKFYCVSTTDVEAVYEVAAAEEVDGILAYASDPAALPSAIVAERLGLPTNPSASVEVLGVKHSWRRFLMDNGFACPKSYSFPPDASLDVILENTGSFAFPLVVKPTDSSGSKGITILNSWAGFEDAVAYADGFSRNKILLVEEYIERGYPAVIGGDIFVWDGKVVLFGEMECLRDMVKSPLIPIGEKWPPQLNGLQRERIHSELQRVVTALDIRFGEMNVEILLDKDDNVHFLELGPRAGGNMIPIQLGDAYCVDLVKANVQAAMGIRPDFVDLPLDPNQGCYMHYVLHSYQSGLFKNIEIDQWARKFVYREVIYKKDGDGVEVFDNAAKALGIIFLNFPTAKDMEYFCQNHDSLIKINLK